MIKLEELDNIYDHGDGPGDPTPTVKPRKAVKLEELDSGPTSSFDFSRGSQYDPREYTKYMPEGLYEQMGDPNLRRGERQSAWDKWGNMLVGGVMKLGTSFAENVGYLGSLPGMVTSSDNNDFSNALTDAAKQASQWIDEQFPIYRKNNDTFGLTDAGWWAQNIQNLGVSAASFAVEGAGFAKVFGMLGKATEALGGGIRAMKAANKATELLTSGALAYTEGAQMGKDVYDKTYNTQVKNYLRSGMSLSEADAAAKHIASQSAATTVQLNTMINTGLNLEMLSGLFAHKNEEALQAFWKKAGKQAAGEDYAAFSKRIRTGTSIEDDAIRKEVFKHEGLKHYAESALSEGIEELTNNFAQNTGEDLGQQWDDKKKSGRTEGVLEQLLELEHYYKRTLGGKDNASFANGALSFVLGAVGGVAQGAILNNLPIHTVEKLDPEGKPIPVMEKDADGNDTKTQKTDERGNPLFETKRVTARAKGKYHDTQTFNNVRDAIVADLTFIDNQKEKIAKARAGGFHDEADKLSDQLFHAMNYNAVGMGMASNYEQTYKEIGATDNVQDLNSAKKAEALQKVAEADTRLQAEKDPGARKKLQEEKDNLQKAYDAIPTLTEAMNRGYAKDTNDNEYKKKAEEAAGTLRELESIYNKVQAKYHGDFDPAINKVADIIGNRKMSLHVQSKRISRVQSEINQIEAEHDQLLDAAGDLEGFGRAETRYTQNWEAQNEVLSRLTQQHNLLVNARQAHEADPTNRQAKATIDNMIRKYSAVGLSEADDTTAADGIVDNLRKRIDQAQEKLKQTDDALFNSTGYNTWLERHPEGKYEDYRNTIIAQSPIAIDLKRRKAFLADQKAEHEEGTRHLMELESERGLTRMKKKAEILQKELDKKETEKWLKAQVDNAKQYNTFVAKQKNLLKQQNRLQQQYYKELQELQERYEALVKRLGEINDELRKMGTAFTTQAQVDRFSHLNGIKRDVQYTMDTTQARIAKLQTLYSQVTSDLKETQNFLDSEEAATPPEDLVEENATSHEDSQGEGEAATALPDEEAQQEEPPQQEEPSPSVQAAEALKTAAAEFDQAIKGQTQSFQNKIRGYAENLIASGEPVNLDLLAQTPLPVSEAAKIMLAVQNYVQAARQQGALMNEEEQAAEELTAGLHNQMLSNKEELVPEDDDDEPMPRFGIPETNRIRPNTEATLNEAVHAEGKKAAEAVKVQNLQLNYVHYFDKKSGTYKRFSEIHKLVQSTNPDIHDPNKLGPGTGVFLSVDTGYKGKTNVYDQMVNDDFGDRAQVDEEFGDFVDGNNHISPEKALNVPIKITDSNGKVLGWLTKIDWVNSKYPGAEGKEAYNNMQAITYDEDGNPVDNIALQNELLSAVRTAVVDSYHNGTNKVATTITSSGPGVLTLNREVNKNTEKYKDFVVTDHEGKPILDENGEKIIRPGRVEWRKTTDLMPDPSLKMGIVGVSSDGSVRVLDGYNQPFKGNVVTDGLERFNGTPVLLLPAPNGDFHVAPMLSKSISGPDTSPSVFNTLVRAIEVFIGNTADDAEARKAFDAEAAKIENGTGFNIRTEAGLRNFINQYFTYTQNYEDSATTAVAEKGGKAPMQFMFSVDDKLPGQMHGTVRVGVSFSGKASAVASLKEGKLNKEFVDQLREGLSGRFRAVNFDKTEAAGKSKNAKKGIPAVKGINSKGPFRAAAVNKAGVWSFREYPSYNEYIKDHTTTNVVGTNRDSTGRYVYAVHGQITLDVHKIIGKPKVKLIESSLPDSDVAEEAENSVYNVNDEVAAGPDLFNFSLSTPEVRIENKLGLEASKDMRPVSYDLLEQMRKFTAPEHLNGLSVEQVLENLKRTGITHLPEGYNPFSKCM